MRRKIAVCLAVLIAGAALFSGCDSQTTKGADQKETSTTEEITTNNDDEQKEEEDQKQSDSLTLMNEMNGALKPVSDHGEYRNFYEIFVYSFYDSDGDGIGDLNGITQKLDYLNDGDDATDDDLGVDAIWLMPVMPSTTYHKYDVIDYYGIDKQYGTLDDFKNLMQECSKRGIDVILDLVMNHSSSQNEWFLECSRYLQSLSQNETPNATDCPYVNYYHIVTEEELAENPSRAKYYSIGTSNWYYEAQFWDAMPDLNLENESVMKEFEDITDFWMDLGVAGFRLDAVGEYETGNVEKSIAELKDFVDRIKAKHPDCYLVGEIWKDMPTYTRFYQSGIDSCFDFAFADSTGVIANTIKGANGYTASSYGKAQENIQRAILENSETGIDAPFYSNHDLARSAGYYAGDNSTAQTKIAHAMNLFMSGNAFLYYGEELGMKGSGKDENKRAPMYWNNDKDSGICAGPPDMDSIKMKYGSLEEQKEDGNSIYQYIKQIYRIKSAYPQIAGGTVTFVEECSSDQVCLVKKEYEGSTIAIVYNISDQEQEVDLSGLSLKEENNLSIGGVLLTGDQQVSLLDNTLNLPPYSVVVLE